MYAIIRKKTNGEEDVFATYDEKRPAFIESQTLNDWMSLGESEIAFTVKTVPDSTEKINHNRVFI